MMRVVVTGAAGFVGRAVARGLADSHRMVTALSRRGDSDLDDCIEAAGDLRSESYLRHALEGAEVVFHIAARVGMSGAWRDFELDNIVVTENLLRAAARSGASAVVFTSSPSVVFNGNPIEGGNEALPLRPLPWAKYPVTKARAELRVAELSLELGLRSIILRPHLVWGPGDRHLAPSLDRLVRRGHLMCPNRPRVKVDPTHISDVVQAHLLAGEKVRHLDAGQTSTYFITGGRPTELWPLAARLVAATTGVDVAPRPVPVEAVRFLSWAGEQLARVTGQRFTPPVPRFAFESALHSQWFDLGRSQRDLGYVPRMTTDRGLDELARARELGGTPE